MRVNRNLAEQYIQLRRREKAPPIKNTQALSWTRAVQVANPAAVDAQAAAGLPAETTGRAARMQRAKERLKAGCGEFLNLSACQKR